MQYQRHYNPSITISPIPALGGTQHEYHFENLYGASVVQHWGSYGGRSGLWELAVLKYDPIKDQWPLCYTTPITDDVLGYLTEEAVQDLLDQIAGLE